jgi:hypothetical protein
MKIERQIITVAELRDIIERVASRDATAAGIEDTVRPISVRRLYGEALDRYGCNWAVSFVEGRDVTPLIEGAIVKCKALYNLA